MSEQSDEIRKDHVMPDPDRASLPFQIAGQAGNDGKGCRQIRQPAAQSKLREPFDVARAAYFVLAMAIYSPDFVNYIPDLDCISGDYKRKTEAGCSASVLECGGRDSNSHRLTPTTPSK